MHRGRDLHSVATRGNRAGQGVSRTAPVVALTANVLPEQVEQFLAAGMDTHVGKPFDPDELLATVGLCSTAAAYAA